MRGEYRLEADATLQPGVVDVGALEDSHNALSVSCEPILCPSIAERQCRCQMNTFLPRSRVFLII
jgi:hypothetical protein